MENWQKMHIRKNLDNLIKVTDCNVELLSLLESMEQLSISDVESLNVRKQNEGKLAQARLLYDILVARINGYRTLVEALLKTKQTGAILILLEAFLQQREVIFQGQQISMTKVLSMANINLKTPEFFEKITDLSTMLALTNDKTVFNLAHNTIPDTLSYYISRTLSYRSRLSVEMFKEQSTDIFVFEGITRTQLTQLAFPNHTDVSGSQLDQGKITARFILLDLRQDFQALCKISDAPIHLINVLDDKFCWQKTKGSLTLIQQHVHKYQDEVSDTEFIDNISNETKSFCISDTPGMGKTVLLANVARALDKVKQNSISFFFPFSEFVQEFSVDRKKINVASVLQNISYLGSQTSIGKYILNRILENQSFTFDLFLDGYDEILPEKFQIAQQVLAVVTKEIQNCRIFITTRPHLRTELENHLETLAINIYPFRESHQIDFIVKYWEQFIDIDTDQDNVVHFSRYCLQSLQSCISDTELVLAGIPLQCMLLADICLPKLLRYLKTKDTLPSVTSSLFSMYEQLMDIRFKKAEEEEVRRKRGSYRATLLYNSILGKRKWNRRVIDYHILAAIKVLFPESSLEFEPMLLGTSIFESNIHINVIGLMEEKCFNDKLPRFVHRTFAEYLFAQFVVEMIRKSSIYRPYQYLVETLLDIVIKSVLVTNTYMETPLTNPHFKLTTNILLAEVRNPVMAYFIDWRLRKVPVEDLNTELIPKFFRVRHLKADSFIHEVIATCLSKNQSALANYLLNLYTLPAMHADNLIKVASKYSDPNLLHNLIQNLLRHHTFEQLFSVKKNSISSLEIAAQRGNYSVFEVLLKLNQKHLPSLQRVLHFCVAYSFQDSAKVLEDKKQIIATILGINKDFLEITISPEDTTPLLQPNIHFELFQHLVNNGANINALTALGETCLHRLLLPVETKVVIHSSTFTKTLNLVQQKGFEGFKVQNIFKKTSLQLAIESIDLDEDIFKLFRTGGYSLDDLDDNLENLLFYSIRHHRSVNHLRILVKLGFKITIKNLFEQNLLHVCADVGNAIALQFVVDNSKVFMSLLNETDVNGNTPLHVSMIHNTPQHHQIRNILLLNGANPNFVNCKGNIPLLEALEIGHNLTVTIPCIQILKRFGLNISKEIASLSILNMMCNVNFCFLDIQNNFKSVFAYFVHSGGEICIETLAEKSNIEQLNNFIIDQITNLPLKDKINVAKELGIDCSRLNEIKNLHLVKICQAMLNLSDTHSFILLRRFFQSTINHCVKFVRAPDKVLHFLKLSSEYLLVVKTSCVEIFITRIHETMNPSIPCVDVEYLNNISDWSTQVIIVQGYNKNLLDSFCKYKKYKVICLPKPHEYDKILNVDVLEDKLMWNYLSFNFQQDIVKNTPNIVLSEVEVCDDELALAIIQNTEPQRLLLSSFIYKQIVENDTEMSTLTCEKLICMAVRILFPTLKDRILKFETQLGYVDLSFLVKNFVLLKVSHGLTNDHVFTTKSTAAYFVALAVKDEISNTVKICNEVLEAMMRMPNSKITNILKADLESNEFYSKDVILFLNCMNSSFSEVMHTKKSYFSDVNGSIMINPLLKILLFAHVLPCFCYMENSIFIDKFMEISKGPLLSPKGNSLTGAAIMLKSVKYASFFPIDYMMNLNDGILNYLQLSEIREFFYSVVADTHKENLFLVSSRINFINKFIKKCKRINSSKDIMSSSLLVNNIHCQIIKHLINLGSDPYTVDINKQTIAHKCTTYLSSNDYHSLVEFLIKSNFTAILSHEGFKRETPVENMLCNLQVKPETMKLLIENNLIPRKLLIDSKQNLLHCAIKGGQSRPVLEVIYNFALNKSLYEQAIFDAIEFNNIEALEYVIELNADINKKDSLGRSPIHYCIKFCDTTLFCILDILIKAGADVNKKDINRHTPLWYAWYENRQGSPNQHVIEYLSQNGAIYS